MEWKDLEGSVRERPFWRSVLSTLWRALLLTAAALSGASALAYGFDWLRSKGAPGTLLVGSPIEWASTWSLNQWAIIALALLSLSILLCAAHLVHVAGRVHAAEVKRAATPEDRLNTFRSHCDSLCSLLSSFPAGAEFEAADKALSAIDVLLKRSLLEQHYFREHSSFVDAYRLPLEIAAANSKGDKIDPQFSKSIAGAAKSWLASLRTRATPDMLRLD